METGHPISPVPLPSDTDLAELFGLSDLHIGRHFLRDQNGTRVDAVNVRYVWKAISRPSFHPPVLVAVVNAGPDEFRNHTVPGFLRGVYWTAGSWALADLACDDVALAFQALNVLEYDQENMACLDGVGYEFSFLTNLLCVSVQFSNPYTPELKRCELQLMALSEKIIQDAKHAPLIASLDRLRQYNR